MRTVSTAGAPIAGIRVSFSAYGDGFTTVTADGVTDENGRCTVRMETLPNNRECTAEITRQTTPDGFTWQSSAVSVEPGAEKAVKLYGVSASALFDLTVKVRGADGVTLTDYAASEYAETVTVPGPFLTCTADGGVLTVTLSKALAEGRILAAEYGANGKMLALRTENVTSALTYTLPLNGSAASVKVFLTDGDFRPLREAIPVPRSV